MRAYLIVFWCLLVTQGMPLVASARDSEYESLAKALAGLDNNQVLDKVQSGGWPKLPALSIVSPEARKNVEAITSAVLESLKQEAHSIATLSNSDKLLRGTLRAASVSNAARSSGGYLNDLIAASSDRVFLLGSWNILDRYPELVLKLVPVIESRRGLAASPKAWFLERYALDPGLVSKKDEIHEMEPSTSGFQIAMQLQPQGKDASELASVFDRMKQPSVAGLWWEVYIMDFRINAVLRSAIDFVIQGGTLVPEPENKPAAMQAVFGADGSPYHHELRRGAIRSGDIWTEWKAAREESMRDLQVTQWFGK